MATAASSLSQTQKKMDTIAANIANVNTTGYKRREATFQNLLTQSYLNGTKEEIEPGRETPDNLRVGFGSKIGLTDLRFEQGTAQETGRDLDVMLEDENVFFRLQGDNGPLYTRDGSLEFQNSGADGSMTLVSSNGKPLLDADGGVITSNEPVKDFSINKTGQILITGASGNEQTFQLSVARVNRPQSLMNAGGNEFRPADNNFVENETITLLPNDEIRMRQGFLEMSNVDLTNETTEMISTQRMIQFQSQAIKMADEMMGLANTIKR